MVYVWKGSSTTKKLKKELSYAQRLADDWERDSPLNCPMKLPWDDHCRCYDCAFASNGAGSVVNSEVANPGLEAMYQAPTANNSAESLPKLARVAANLSPAARQAKQEEERRAAIGKDAPLATDDLKESLLASKERERKRERAVLKKMARETMESMKWSRSWQYQSILKSDLEELEDELERPKKDKLATVKEVLKQNQELVTILDDMSRRVDSFIQEEDEEQTSNDPHQSNERPETGKAVTSSPTTCGSAERLLFALSLFGCTLRFMMRLDFWCRRHHASWPPSARSPTTIQTTTIVWMTPALVMMLACWRMFIAPSPPNGRAAVLFVGFVADLMMILWDTFAVFGSR